MNTYANKLFVVITCCLLMNASYAYNADDVSMPFIGTPFYWSSPELIKKEYGTEIKTHNYFKLPWSSEAILCGNMHKSQTNNIMGVEKTANTLYSGLKNIFEEGGCAVSELKPFGNNRQVPFIGFISDYQCRDDKGSGLFIIIDADPDTMYLYTYKVKPNVSYDDMIKRLSPLIKICYQKDMRNFNKDKDCYSVLSQ